mgnify:CR=1 FL=1
MELCSHLFGYCLEPNRPNRMQTLGTSIKTKFHPHRSESGRERISGARHGVSGARLGCQLLNYHSQSRIQFHQGGRSPPFGHSFAIQFSDHILGSLCLSNGGGWSSTLGHSLTIQLFSHSTESELQPNRGCRSATLGHSLAIQLLSHLTDSNQQRNRGGRSATLGHSFPCGDIHFYAVQGINDSAASESAKKCPSFPTYGSSQMMDIGPRMGRRSLRYGENIPTKCLTYPPVPLPWRAAGNCSAAIPTVAPSLPYSFTAPNQHFSYSPFNPHAPCFPLYNPYSPIPFLPYSHPYCFPSTSNCSEFFPAPYTNAPITFFHQLNVPGYPTRWKNILINFTRRGIQIQHRPSSQSSTWTQIDNEEEMTVEYSCYNMQHKSAQIKQTIQLLTTL